ncbi:DUF2721 domain-containing protein [Cytophagaceae bacterium ABcell3]|nr:DUF2721 domain-containing protein [Cytophagaceae bacterium ABcell3]
MGDLSVVITILSAMITPAILIVATGSLLLTTSQRLARSIERTRKLSDQFEKLTEEPSDKANTKFEFLYHQLQFASNRARLLQKAMTSLYLAISIFILTSFLIGIFEITNAEFAYFPLMSGMLGAMLLFLASMLLILESRIALKSVNQEMANVLQVNNPNQLKNKGRP